jgi:hypothetical protein
MIFCINSGRSGSEYLASLLGTAKEVTSYHEAEPTMTGKYLRMANEFRYSETFNERRIKSKAVKEILHSLPQGHVYCETNHMFIKTFFDVIMEDFEKVDVVILRRELALVLKSFIEMGYFSPINKMWPNWMSSPNAKTAALACIATDEELDQYDLCIAYLFDVEARALRFREQYPDIKTHEVRLEALNGYENVKTLFEGLRVTPTRKTKKLAGQVINVRGEIKEGFNNPASLGYCRERIDAYIEKARSMGIGLPDTLALNPYRAD